MSASAVAVDYSGLSAFRFRGSRQLLAFIGLIGLAVPYVAGYSAFTNICMS